MKEDTRVLEHNDIKMDIECWGGRGNKNYENFFCRAFTI